MRAALCLLVGLAGCGARSELEVPPPVPVPICGDGIVDEGEACDLGDDNEDRPAILLLHRALRRPVMPVDRDVDAVSFYDYTSESSHTGFEAVDLSAAFLFRDVGTEALSLFVHHGIDEDSSGQTLDHGLVEMVISGLPPGTTMLLADEPHDEISFDGETFEVRWEFWRNTDGVVLGPLPFPSDWTITMSIEFFAGMNRWIYADEDGTFIPLETSEEAILQTFSTPSACRLDCSVPRCGDGIVDGGEVCDDGDVTSGDGCAQDCLSLD